MQLMHLGSIGKMIVTTLRSDRLSLTSGCNKFVVHSEITVDRDIQPCLIRCEKEETNFSQMSTIDFKCV